MSIQQLAIQAALTMTKDGMWLFNRIILYSTKRMANVVMRPS